MMAGQIARLRKLIRVMCVSAWRQAFIRHGVAAGVEHEIVLRQLGAVSAVVDIGANRGQFSLVARRCFPTATIVSFEPLLGPSNVFRSVFAGDSNATVHQAAIAAEAAKTVIHVSRRDDSSSLLPISEMQNEIFPGTAACSTEVIDAGPLSLFHTHKSAGHSLLKLDVQGFELQALVGCEDQLDQFTSIYVECSFVELYEGQPFAGEIIAWLRERGFELVGVYNVAYQRDGKAIQADFLFKRKQPLC